MTDREEFITAIRAQSFICEDGRRIVHRVGSFTGADYDEDAAVADIRTAADVKWIDSGFGHDLAVLDSDQRIWRFNVTRPAGERYARP